jgi:hypothetical protein
MDLDTPLRAMLETVEGWWRAVAQMFDNMKTIALRERCGWPPPVEHGVLAPSLPRSAGSQRWCLLGAAQQKDSCILPIGLTPKDTMPSGGHAPPGLIGSFSRVAVGASPIGAKHVKTRVVLEERSNALFAKSRKFMQIVMNSLEVGQGLTRVVPAGKVHG